MSGPVDFLTGRALSPGYTADTAPASMRLVYEALAPAPGTHYGDVLPIKREADGRLGFAMPNVMREGLLGMADLLSGTETGELTGRGAQSITMGGLGAGMTMAPRGAVAAGGARGTINPYLAMDEAARYSRAHAQGFQPELRLYHGTAGDDFSAFSRTPPATTLGLPSTAIWTTANPEFAARFPTRANALTGELLDVSGRRILPLIPRWNRLSTATVKGDEHPFGITNLPLDAWDAGYDAVRLVRAPGSNTSLHDTYAFRDPNQLRSPFARFDPARRDSDDLMAGFAAPAPVAAPVGFNVREPSPPGLRFDPALVPNELRRLQDRVY